LGKGFGIATSFQPAPQGKPSQMSPVGAADPLVRAGVGEEDTTKKFEVVSVGHSENVPST
jgi:hypothetical protein